MLAGPDIFDIVLPAHNKGASIARAMHEFHRVGRLEGGQRIRFALCEHGSSDDTVPVLRKPATELPLKLIPIQCAKAIRGW